MAVMSMQIQNLACGYPNKNIVSDISFNLGAGELICILGPNGVGKTTLFKTILGFLPRQGGQILLDGVDIKNFPRKKLAQKIAYVPQAHIPPFPFTVQDVILMGRTSRFEGTRTPRPADYEKVDQLLELLHIQHLANRIYTEISGGERQMVLVVRALAQEPQYLIMDEPTSNLDFGNQMRVLEQVIQLKKAGIGIVMTSHYPDQVFLCSSKVLLMKNNNTYCLGTSDEVLTEDNLREAYGINVKIIGAADDDGTIYKSCVTKFD